MAKTPTKSRAPTLKAGAKAAKHPHTALAAHAGKANRIRFDGEHKHGTFRFTKGLVVEFENPAVAGYFDIAFNGTEFTDAEPNLVISAEELTTVDERKGEAQPNDVKPTTLIGSGRDGIDPGTSAHQAVRGETGTGDATLEVQEPTATVRVE